MNLITPNSFLKNENCINIAEELWKLTFDYLDAQFRTEFNKEESFIQRCSEMSVAYDLLINGYQLQKKSNDVGPDFLIIDNEIKTWIEVVAPVEGKYQISNLVEKVGKASVIEVDDNQLILKIASAIYDKKKKYDEYFENSIVSQDDYKIIAINTYNLDSSIDHDLNDKIPFVIKALYGCDSIWYFDNANQSLKSKTMITETRKKKNDTNIPMTSFLSNDYNKIAGCLFFHTSLGDIKENTMKYIINENFEGKITNLFNKYETYRYIEGKLTNSKKQN